MVEIGREFVGDIVARMFGLVECLDQFQRRFEIVGEQFDMFEHDPSLHAVAQLAEGLVIDHQMSTAFEFDHRAQFAAVALEAGSHEQGATDDSVDRVEFIASFVEMK